MTAGQSDSNSTPGTSKEVRLDIKKAKIVSNITLNYEAEEHENGTVNKIKKECGHPIHDDLRLAMSKLNIHLALLCELVDIKSFPDLEFPQHPILEKLAISGVSFGGNDESEGVTIIGSRRLRGNKVLNLISPFQKYEDDTPESYPFTSELYADITNLYSEIEQYIGGKYGEGAQISMEFGDEPLPM